MMKLDIDRIVERYVAIWSESDTAARAAAVAELWPADGVEYVEGVQFRGHDGLVERVAEAYNLFVGSGEYHVTRDGHVTIHDDVVILTIQLEYAKGDQEGKVAWAARVFLVLDDDGRISQDYHLTVRPLPAA